MDQVLVHFVHLQNRLGMPTDGCCRASVRRRRRGRPRTRRPPSPRTRSRRRAPRGGGTAGARGGAPGGGGAPHPLGAALGGVIFSLSRRHHHLVSPSWNVRYRTVLAGLTSKKECCKDRFRGFLRWKCLLGMLLKVTHAT